MFFNTQLLISAVMAVSVLGAPSVKRQEAGPACNGLGAGSYSNRGNFKVAAFNPNGPNDHAYGTELVQGTTGAIVGALATTFTVGSWDNTNALVSIDMTDSGITATSPGNGVSVLVPDNDSPWFVSTSPKPTPAKVWCGVPGMQSGAQRWDYLAAHGRYDLWSLCEQKSDGAPSLFRVAYNVDKSKPNAAFDVNTCVSVYLTIIT